MIDKRYPAFLDNADGASCIQQAILLELLKERGFGAKENKSSLLLWLSFIAPQLFALVIFSIELLFILWAKRKESPQKRYYTTTADRNTTNKHLSKMSEDVDEQLDYLILDSPLKKLEWNGSDGQIYWGRNFYSDLIAIKRYFCSLNEVFTALYKLSCYSSVSIKTMTMCLVRLLRGFSIISFIGENPPQKIVFSLSGNACTSIIEKKMKESDGVTIHWLHGVGLGFNFDSFSDVTLVNNEFDEVFYREKICDSSIFFSKAIVEYQFPKSRRVIKNVVIYTNLVHHASRGFHEKGYRIEEELLSLVSAEFNEQCVYIKPHPTCFSELGMKGDEYRAYIKNFGIELIENKFLFNLSETIYISTISTSYIDLASSGACVLLYDKYGDKNSGFKSLIDPKLKFTSADTLAQCCSLFNDLNVLDTGLRQFKIESKECTYKYVLS